MTGPVTSALVAEATKKAAVVWLSIDGAPASGWPMRRSSTLRPAATTAAAS